MRRHDDWLKRGERFAKKTISTSILRPFRHSCHHWRVGVRNSDVPLLEEGPSGLRAFRWLDSPRGHFYADPMLCRHEDRTWLFVEDFLYAAQEARSILVAEVRDDGGVGAFQPALTRSSHTSYPLVFCHEGEVFMIPETAGNRRVELYRAVRFPTEWHREAVLFPHPAHDTTPLFHDGRWWFFASIVDTNRTMTHLFSAESLTGDWKLHPNSPIAGPHEGRSAGPIMLMDRRMIRPTQSSRPVYGYSFSFEEIVQLDAKRFVERRLATFEPTWRRHLVGMHTYGRAGMVEVIDGCWGSNPHVVM